MENYICVTCGVEFAESEEPPARCPICEDPRQYVGWDGQRWTTMAAMKEAGHRNDVREEEPGLTGIGITPSFSIGQRALLVQTPGGNVLYDCISYLDGDTVERLNALGGVQAICFSHPHFYDSMVTWSRAFGGAPIYVPEADREHVMRPDPSIRYWDGAPLELAPGVTLVRCGGHFAGSAVLHWAGGAAGKGALFRWGLDNRGARPPLCQLHDQLPEPHTALRGRGRLHRRGRRSLRIRPHLRRLVGGATS